jgi:hypothetical protein
MNDLVPILFAIMMGFPHAYRDTETHAEREVRIHDTATAIDIATARATCQEMWGGDPSCVPIWKASREKLALLLVTKAFWESRIAQNVHENRCAKTECDAHTTESGAIVHRARTIWQLQRTSLVVEEWDKMTGTDVNSTYFAAFAASKVMARGFRACKTVHGAFSFYAGVGCSWDGATPRVAFYHKISHKFEVLQKQAQEAPTLPLQVEPQTEAQLLALTP